MSGFTDIHAHFVYGLDDGAKTREDMEALLDAANKNGITCLYATPHVEPGVRAFDEPLFLARAEEARQYCLGMGYPIRIETGAELMYTPAMDARIQDRRLITMGDSDRVLVEFVPDISLRELEYALRLMEESGYRPILAHIERYQCMGAGTPARLKKRYPVQFQVNCRSVVRTAGFADRWRLRHWLKRGVIDYIATDMHNCKSRAPAMQKAYKILCQRFGEEYADCLATAERMTP